MRLYPVLATGLSVGDVLRLRSSWGRQPRRDNDHPQRRLRHDGQCGPGLGRTIPPGTPHRERPSARRRIGCGHRQPDRRQLRHGQHQPQDEGEGDSGSARPSKAPNPTSIIVGYDALAIYVHKDNPLDSISLEELAEIYGEGREHESPRWSQLGVPQGAWAPTSITRVSRQNSSGTYAYFREAVLGPGKDLKLGSIDQSGSKDVVALVRALPSAIGYSGMGYATPEVKMLKVSQRTRRAGRGPHRRERQNNTYPDHPAAADLHLGEPSGAGEGVPGLDSLEGGQKVVLDLGYVPLASA